MSAATDLGTSEREVIRQHADWYSQQGYQVSVEPSPRELPEFLRTLAPDLIALATAKISWSRSRPPLPQFLLLWSIIEAAARHRLSSLKIPPTRRISSSALLKMLLTEGIVEDDDYAVLRRGLAVRNAIAHGFLNQPVDAVLFEQLRNAARLLLRAVSRK